MEIALQLSLPLGLVAGVGAYLGWWASFGVTAAAAGAATLTALSVSAVAMFGITVLVLNT